MTEPRAAEVPRTRQFYLRWSGILIVLGLLVELMSFSVLRTPGGFLTFAFGSGAFLGCGILLYLRSQIMDPATPPRTDTTPDRVSP